MRLSGASRGTGHRQSGSGYRRQRPATLHPPILSCRARLSQTLGSDYPSEADSVQGMTSQPFRFAAQATPQDGSQWLATARRAEALGFSGFSVNAAFAEEFAPVIELLAGC